MTRERMRVVLATETLRSFTPRWRATALALAELGCAAFFVSGIAEEAIGRSAPWYVLAVALLAAGVHAVDVEARGLYVRGGLFGLVRQSLGDGFGRIAAS